MNDNANGLLINFKSNQKYIIELFIWFKSDMTMPDCFFTFSNKQPLRSLHYLSCKK